jgi:hypothetical protein
MSDKQKRYVGLDTHKHYLMVGAVNPAQEVVLPPRKVSLIEFEGWAKKHLRPTDEVVPSTGSGQAWKQLRMPGTSTICSNRWWRGWWCAIPLKSS